MWRANYEAESVVDYFQKYTKSPAPNDQTSFFFVNFGPLLAFRNPELCTAWQRNFRTHGSNSLSLLISSFSLLFFHIFVCFLVFFFSVSFHCRWNMCLYILVWTPCLMHRWKENNICQSIWDKSEVLICRTCWGTHCELGEHIGNPLRT